MPRAFELAAAQPWLMLPSALDNLLEISMRLGDPQALETKLGRALDNTRTVDIRANGVAVVPVIGPIFRYANLFTEISGATSTQVLATDIQAALDNPAVTAIVLNIDSPGGVASGINELAELIYQGRSQKRIAAYIGGSGASGAYWLASAAHEIVIDETAIAGSVGVVVEAVVDKEGGAKTYQIVSRNAPNKRPDLSTEEGRAKVAETVDALEDVFVAKVARNLGVDAESVPGMGDHGGLRVGAAAVDAGLAHRLGSLEGLITELGKPAVKKPRTNIMAKVSSTQELQAALAEGADPATIEFCAPGTDIEAASKTAAETATVAERSRIEGITALASAGFETEVKAAIDSGMSVEAAGLSLFKAAQDRGVTLAGIKKDAKAAAVASPAAAAGAAVHSTKSIWAARKGAK